MKSILCLIFFSLLSLNTVFAQTAAEADDKALFIYEESNSNIDPWTILFKNEFQSKGKAIDMIDASTLKKENIDISQYKVIIIHGVVNLRIRYYLY